MKKRFKNSIPGTVCHYIGENTIWATNGYKILRSTDLGRTWGVVAEIPTNLSHKFGNKIRIIQRLFRLRIHNILVLDTETLLVFSDGMIFRYQLKDERFQTVHKLRKGRRPLQQGLCLTNEGNIFYGEYWANPDRGRVGLWCSEDLGFTWNKRYIFNVGSIRHIHAVQHDPYTDLLWVTTGDFDSECQILYSKDEGRSFDLLGGGSQRWRTVSLMFTPEYIIWGTDAGFDEPEYKNKFIAYRRSNDEIIELNGTDGPIYYSTRLDDGTLLAGTTVEGGKNEEDHKAHLWASENGLAWYDIASWQKDRYPFIMGYGVLSFPQGKMDKDHVFVSGKGLQNFDNKTIEFKII